MLTTEQYQAKLALAEQVGSHRELAARKEFYLWAPPSHGWHPHVPNYQHGHQMMNDSQHGQQLMNDSQHGQQLINDSRHGQQLMSDSRHGQQLINDSRHGQQLMNDSRPTSATRFSSTEPASAQDRRRFDTLMASCQDVISEGLRGHA